MRKQYGVWPSLVRRLVWDEEIAGSNPVTPMYGCADSAVMTWFVLAAGTLIYLVAGAAIDAVLPAAHLLGFNLQGLVFSTLCMIGALWLALRLELFD